jgi:protein-disulfide isomerase/uncharacterized membrane protein/thiol-disulfide isomerase/thioredoxin
MDSKTDANAVHRGWAMLALLPVLLISAGVAAYLGWVHLLLTHGAGAFESACNLGGAFDCDKVNTSRWSELLGIPVSLWAVPLYLAMGWLALIGRRADARGARARGSLVLVAGWNVLVSLVLAYISVFVLEYICLFCVGLYALHALSLVLVLLPPGGRTPSLPRLGDTAVCAAVALVALALLYPLSMFLAAGLDQAVVEQLEQAAAPAQDDGPAAGGRALGGVKLPENMVHIEPLPHAPTLGPIDAPVSVVVVSDFQCSYCRRLQGSLASLEERYGERVRWSFVHYPLDQSCNPHMSRDMHPRACAAAVAAQCAQHQGRFWDYHDQLFLNQRYLEDADLRVHAERVGLDLEAFDACVAGPLALAELRKDIELAHGMGITGTPRTHVNGRQLEGALPERILDAAIRVALGEADQAQDGSVVAVEHEREVEPLAPGAMPMVRIESPSGGFYIDAVESALDAGGRALSVAGTQPASASWHEAQAACAAAGKRLCSQAEWLSACRGQPATDDDGDGDYFDDYVEGRPYPYGVAYESRRCNDHLGREVGRARAAGAHAACVTPEGVHDLGGNLSEWVGLEPERAVLLGGAFFEAEKASCLQAFDVFGTGFSNLHTGIRCCADQQVEGFPDAEPVSRLVEPLAPGDPFPVLQGRSPVGRETDNAALQGKLQLVSIWASWCRPCQAQLEALKQLHGEYGPERLGLLVMGVDRDHKKGKTLRAKGLDFTFLQDNDGRVLTVMGALAMPTTVLVGGDGRVIATWKGWSDEREAELRAQLATYLGQPATTPGDPAAP